MTNIYEWVIRVARVAGERRRLSPRRSLPPSLHALLHVCWTNLVLHNRHKHTHTKTQVQKESLWRYLTTIIVSIIKSIFLCLDFLLFLNVMNDHDSDDDDI